MQKIDYSIVADYLQQNLGLEPEALLLEEVRRGEITPEALDAIDAVLATGGPGSSHCGRKAAEAIKQQHASRVLH